MSTVKIMVCCEHCKGKLIIESRQEPTGDVVVACGSCEKDTDITKQIVEAYTHVKGLPPENRP